MNLSIRRWLKERHLAIKQNKELSTGQIAAIAYRIVQEIEAKALTPFDICPLAEVFVLPLSIVWEDIHLLSQLTESILDSLSQKKALRRNEGTWLAFQIAYLQALQQILLQEVSLKRQWLDRAIIPIAPIHEEVEELTLSDSKLEELLKNLRPGKLTDKQAEQALALVADSLLVQQMNGATVAWLIANGAEEPEAKLLTKRLLYSLPGDLLIVITNNAASLAQLQKFVRLGNLLPPNTINSQIELSGIVNFPTVADKIDLYREYYRASILQNRSIPLFMESFALKDIFVPLTGVLVEESNVDTQEEKEVVTLDLMTWCQQQLDDLTTMTIIQSESGYGKSTFCQTLAARIAQEHYPNWMPILIQLRDINYGQTLVETLNSAFSLHEKINLSTWLEKDYPRCLLILDGWDELFSHGQTNRAKTIFIDQLIKFQSLAKHKIILTNCSKSLTEIPPQFLQISKIITIQPLDVDELRQWFQHWSIVQSLSVAQNFFTFLKKAGVFAKPSNLPGLSSFVRQPLMLYLLAILHRDGLLDHELLELSIGNEQGNYAPLLWAIYQRLNCWFLGYPQPDGIKTMLLRAGTSHIHRTPTAIANLLGDRHPQDLLNQMQDIALKILQSDRHQVHFSPASINQNLPAFYFRSSLITKHKEPQIRIEFSHPKLGEYLYIQAIVCQLQELTQQQEDNYGKITFILESTTSLPQKIYQLLGYGILTEDIEKLLLEGLRKQQKNNFSLAILYQRLEDFWRDYCQGRWLNEGIAHQAWNYLQTLNNPLNVEQINAAVGLNIFLLLCSISQEIKTIFYPCGNPSNLREFYPNALIELMNRIAILHKNAFSSRLLSKSLAGINLSEASLSQVMWNDANLQGINLSDTDLTGANLVNTNLQQANLQGANLTGANLTGANLQRVSFTGANLTKANLTNANLTGVNLNSVNLTQTLLFGAILDNADKEFAALNGALFSPNDITSTIDLPPNEPPAHPDNISSNNDTSIWESHNPIDSVIQMAEGIPILPTDFMEL
ncbi:pentapeptide repeat-containing protein [Anabaena sp. UHCC 0204]|uniref:pentapeptide repeat-containing protein n=1 Tax=Anabaena sp. UHCC 0204 TaxID=2590009 RepID=UPI0014484871|nr:pentapeptide repeat-containing protein [Anabaena sp. UHCC 0204]MTJ10328.1 NACHT domain-containing protein [Anabaena sp. UHCC 0204]